MIILLSQQLGGQPIVQGGSLITIRPEGGWRLKVLQEMRLVHIRLKTPWYSVCLQLNSNFTYIISFMLEVRRRIKVYRLQDMFRYIRQLKYTNISHTTTVAHILWILTDMMSFISQTDHQ